MEWYTSVTRVSRKVGRVCVCVFIWKGWRARIIWPDTRGTTSGDLPPKQNKGGGAGQIKWSLIPWTLWPLQTFVYVAVLCCLICVTMDWSVVYRRHRRRGCCFDGKGKGCSFLLDWLTTYGPATGVESGLRDIGVSCRCVVWFGWRYQMTIREGVTRVVCASPVASTQTHLYIFS